MYALKWKGIYVRDVSVELSTKTKNDPQLLKDGKAQINKS